MKLFKNDILKSLYDSRAKQVGIFLALGMAIQHTTSNIEWIGLSQKSQELISNVGLSAAIGLTVGTVGVSALTELSEYISRSNVRKIEKDLGSKAFEIIDNKNSLSSLLTDESQVSNTIKIENNESLESILDKGIEAKKVKLDDIIPVLNEKVEPDEKETLKLNSADDIVIEVTKVKKKLPQSVLDKLVEKEADLYPESISIVNDFDDLNERKDPEIGTIKEDINIKENKIEPTIKESKAQESLSVKNTEIEMNIKKESKLIEIFNKKKSCNDLDIKRKNSIQNKLK